MNPARLISRSHPRVLAAAACAVLLTTATACGDGGKGSSAAGGPLSGQSVILVAGPLSDPFFGAMKKGAEDAGKMLGVSVDYTAPNDFSNPAGDLTRLIEAAITKKPTSLVVGNFIPPAEEPLIKKAVGAGITVTVINSGLGSWESLGAKAFVGENPTGSGSAAGRDLAGKGVRHGLCINHVPENPALQQRCDGFTAELKKAGGNAAMLTIPSSQASDQQAVTQAVQGYLRSHKDVDGILTLGTAVAQGALKAREASGAKTIKIGTTDISTQVLNQVKDGALEFAIDQQPYLQSFYGVLTASQSKAYGLRPAGPIMTSPLILTKANVDEALAAQKRDVRGAA
ncbi:substrate-binding domain-containing protein [Actinomadura graeca]|uniref:Substrate-binding domain-containing protein n=1 Tax=Actinomadura graeca TaxID=2750812 RepID=A0ABX8QYP8_9ACTN|nr:substrate-binding domain-containing protein [Actinomadura graeca]QXJ23867.1 substrate-binding domain-containing protein [Actinomadura graeca]